MWGQTILMAPPSSVEPRTVRVDPDRLDGWLDRFQARHGAIDTVAGPDRVRCTAPDGAVAEILLRWGPVGAGGDLLAEVSEQFRRDRTVGVLLVRRKAHAVGVFHGAWLQSGHHDHHYVQGRTKAGGWSQQRYARRRSNQADRAFAAAAEDVQRILVPQFRTLKALVLGGDGGAVRTVLADPDFDALRNLAGATRHPVYSIADPNRTVLEGFAAVFRAVPIQLNELA